MVQRAGVTVTGRETLERALDAMDPKRRPIVVRGALTELGTDLVQLIRGRYLMGPSPNFLERRTGETSRSIVLDRSGLPQEFVEVGSLAELWWLELFETGRGPRGHRPFLAPAVADLIPRIEEVFFRHWQREIARA